MPVTVPDLCAGYGTYRGWNIRGRRPVAGMDHPDIDQLWHAQL